MFESFSFLPKVFHEVISVYILFYSLIIGAYIHYEFFYPYELRAMSLKYMPKGVSDIFTAVLLFMIYGWVGYAIGEWLIIFTIVSIPIFLTVMLLEYTRVKEPELFNILTIGGLFFIVLVTLFMHEDSIGTFGR